MNIAQHVFEVPLNIKKMADITEKTYIKLTLPAFTILIASIVSFVFSLGIFIFDIKKTAAELESEVGKRVTIVDYEKDMIRDSIARAQNKSILAKIDRDVTVIKKKLSITNSSNFDND